MRDHREAVGGLWDQMGHLQWDFLVSRGLQPEHHFLDVGCGSMRGGVHFVRYLAPGHYFGLDIDESLLAAGRMELGRAGLAGRAATLLADDRFRFHRFGCTFDFALAQSVFTHISANSVMRCLAEMERALVPGGRFYATYFENPGARLSTEHRAIPDGFVASIDADPFHYDPDFFRWAVEGSTLRCEVVGDWGHPREQRMLEFTKR